jgi:hypothetical protein
VSDDAEKRFPEDVAIKGERRQIARQEYTMRKRVLDLLRAGGPKTIPEIAAALGVTPREAMWWTMGYVRYGFVAATEEVTAQGYYKYKIVEGA